MVGAGGGMWSVSNVVGGRCFAYFLVGGRLLFSRMVGGRCLNQYMVGGRWLMVDGRWSVVGGWSVAGGFVLRRGDSYLLFMLCQSSLLSTVISFEYEDKLWFDESMSAIFCMENT